MIKMMILLLFTIFGNYITNIKAKSKLYNFKWENTLIEVPVGLSYNERDKYELYPKLVECTDNFTNTKRDPKDFSINPTSDYYSFNEINFSKTGTYKVMFRARHNSDPDCFNDILVKYIISDREAPRLDNKNILKNPIEYNVGDSKPEAKEFMLDYFLPRDNYSTIRTLNTNNNQAKSDLKLHEELLGYNLINFKKTGLYSFKYIITDGSQNRIEYKGYIKIVDKKGPTIIHNGKRLEIEKGKKINIHDYFVFEDNYDQKVHNISITPEVITNDVESVKITAIDANNNKTTLTVNFIGLRKKAQIIFKKTNININPNELNLLEKIKANIASFINVDKAEESQLKISHNLGNSPYEPNKYYAYISILNSNEYKIEINVIDDKAPKITPNKVNEELIYEYNEQVMPTDFLRNFTIVDDVDNENVDVTINPREIKTNKLGYQEIEIKASDKTGNYNKYIAVIKVVDSKKPVIKQIKDNIKLYEDEYINYKNYFNITDNYGLKEEPSLDHNIYNEPGIYRNKITAIDLSNNIAEYEFSITIIEREASIKLKNKTIELNISDPNYEKEIIYNVLRIENNKHNYKINDIKLEYDNQFDINKNGTSVVSYYIKSKTVLGEVVIAKIDCNLVVKDLLPPIARQKDSEIKIPVLTKNFNIYDYFEFSDNVSPLDDITLKLIEGKLNLKETGYYYLKCSITDKAKNENRFSVSVHVIDNEAPEIIVEKKEYKVNLDERINFKNLITANDNYSKKVYLNIDDYVIDYKKPGEYIVKVSARDEANNVSTIELKVTVIDNVIPKINLHSQYLEHEIGTTPIDLKNNINEVSDNISKLSLANINIEHNIDYTYPGYYDIIYSVKDDGGNIAIEKARIFVHYKDNPQLTFINNKMDTNTMTKEAIIKNLKVNDNRNITYEITSDVENIKKPGKYNIKLLIKDELGMLHEEILTLNVTNKKSSAALITLLLITLILCGISILTTYIILKKKIKVNLADNYETELYEEITTPNDDQNS